MLMTWLFRRRINQAVIIGERIEIYLIGTTVEDAEFLVLGLDQRSHQVIRAAPGQTWRIEKSEVVPEQRESHPLEGYHPYTREGAVFIQMVRNYHPDGVAVGFYIPRNCKIRRAESSLDRSEEK
jgi:hypothetical protein